LKRKAIDLNNAGADDGARCQRQLRLGPHDDCGILGLPQRSVSGVGATCPRYLGGMGDRHADAALGNRRLTAVVPHQGAKPKSVEARLPEVSSGLRSPRRPRRGGGAGRGSQIRARAPGRRHHPQVESLIGELVETYRRSTELEASAGTADGNREVAATTTMWAAASGKPHKVRRGGRDAEMPRRSTKSPPVQTSSNIANAAGTRRQDPRSGVPRWRRRRSGSAT